MGVLWSEAIRSSFVIFKGSFFTISENSCYKCCECFEAVCSDIFFILQSWATHKCNVPQWQKDEVLMFLILFFFLFLHLFSILLLDGIWNTFQTLNQILSTQCWPQGAKPFRLPYFIVRPLTCIWQVPVLGGRNLLQLPWLLNNMHTGNRVTTSLWQRFNIQ